MHKSDSMVNNTRHVQAICALRRATFKGQILGKFVFDVYIHVFVSYLCLDFFCRFSLYSFWYCFWHVL